MFRDATQLQRGNTPSATTFLARFHIDAPLLAGLLLLCAFGLFVLYSATGQSSARTTAQAVRLGVAVVAMIALAQVPPAVYRRWAWAGYALGLALLVVVLIAGVEGKGAQRWIDVGIRFQPSEIMKIAVPMAAAAYLYTRALPPNFTSLAIVTGIILPPVLLIARQPDLGTAILIGASGAIVVLLAGLRLRVILVLGALIGAALPLLWQQLRDYQRQRVLTLFDPESDPLGAGYNIIQSVLRSGRYSSCPWVPLVQPLPNSPPEPIAILDWMML